MVAVEVSYQLGVTLSAFVLQPLGLAVPIRPSWNDHVQPVLIQQV